MSTPSEGYVYSPALVLLPADVREGASGASAGSASDTLDYRSELHAEAGSSGCLNVIGEVRYLSKEGQLGRVVTIGQTWCQREGVVAESQSFADVRTVTSRIDPPEPTIPTTSNSPIRLVGAATLDHQIHDARSPSTPPSGRVPWWAHRQPSLHRYGPSRAW